MPLARVVLRGLVRLMSAARQWWPQSTGRRGPVLGAAAAAAVAAWVVPYGVLIAAAGLTAAAWWAGRADSGETEGTAQGPDARECERLRVIHDALAAVFSAPPDWPVEDRLHAHGEDCQKCIAEFRFGAEGRLTALRLRYPAYFADGDSGQRERVEQVLAAKLGREREVRFRWEEERNEVCVTVAEELPTGWCVQRFVTAPGEVVLGFTDAGAVDRTLPVDTGDGSAVDAAAVVWRTGVRSQFPHLLVAGLPGSGATSLLRCVALQALRAGQVLLIDGSGTGEYACFAGRRGVVAVESAPGAAVAALEWAARETERRLLDAGAAGGRERVREGRALWIVVDRPGLLGHLAELEGAAAPRELLEVPLRYGRAAGVTVVLAEHIGELESLGAAVLTCARARVVLGPAPPSRVQEILGVPAGGTPAAEWPAGRGWARVGGGRALRIQTPAAPDPDDRAAGDPQRRAVLELLPPSAVCGGPEGEPDGEGAGSVQAI
ncbi:membrane protein [Streptomyces sodiiphilus]|uniref:Membrane protein n=1 Tax=Streptomyces sodiiphilus TaxID=226217 RepID=A0ABN2NQ96_9ACTN